MAGSQQSDMQDNSPQEMSLQELSSQRAVLQFTEQDLSDVAESPGYLNLLSKSIAATIARLAAAFWSKLPAVVSVQPPQEGSIIFPVQVDFSCKTAAGIFREKMENIGGNKDLLAPYQHMPHVVVLDEACTADPQMPNLENQIQQTINAITEATNTMYCRGMLAFLQRSLGMLAAHPFRMPAHAAGKKWRQSVALLLHKLSVAQQLVRWHNSLDVDVLYRAVDTKAEVEHVLKSTKSFLSYWDLPGSLEFPDVLPTECFQRDREILDRRLKYVFEGQQCDFGDDGAIAKQQWDIKKEKLDECRLVLAVIPEQDIIWEDRSGENVHKVTWHAKKLAGKQIVPYSGRELDLEDFQKFYADVFDMVSDAQYMVKLHGVTTTGGILMDLANSNLRQWYLNLVTTAVEEIIALKLRVMSQAAAALHSVHASGRVHGRVQSSNFLIFGDNPEDPIVKIADLPLPVEHWHKDCLAFSTTGHWVAKEVYEGRIPGSKSDVFSFGCLLYELVMEELPYGHETSEAEIMESRLAGRPPFVIPEEKFQEWPCEVLELMTKCTLPNLNARPTMQDVDSCLRKWYPETGAHQVPPVWKHLPWPIQRGRTLLHLAAERGLKEMALFHLAETRVDYQDE
eukprot:evm.model.scf_541.1 EVM.evm.TU.scf_541.1   scf_541:13253-18064(-)